MAALAAAQTFSFNLDGSTVAVSHDRITTRQITSEQRLHNGAPLQGSGIHLSIKTASTKSHVRVYYTGVARKCTVWSVERAPPGRTWTCKEHPTALRIGIALGTGEGGRGCEVWTLI